tara:strand:- start:1370 stop:3418 length:2049 start_codon:yes stop_codon:yes gene_type:complete
MLYRPEIDGLRALAVIPVIFFHAGFTSFSGGYVGVDVFFVISGYLITTILINDIENNKYSLLSFYERRARRILPALFFIMLVCIPFAWLWMLPGAMQDFSNSLIAVSFFASNILFWRESGYFSPSAEEKPLLHTWSLAVEEQYYLLFPIFLVMIWRFGKNKAFYTILIILVISFLLSEWGWRNKATANFYLSPTRAWELLSGSLIAFLIHKRGIKKNNLLSMLGFLAIIFSIYVYDESTPFPSIYTLLPVSGTVALIYFADKHTFMAKILSNKLIVGIGLISYSAYLWHQPLFAFARIRSFEHPSNMVMIFLACLSIILAYFSWKYIEQPFRDKKIFSRKFIFTFSICGILIFSSVGIYGNFKKGIPSRIANEINTLYEKIDQSNERLIGNGCNLSSIIPEQPMPNCIDFFVDGGITALLIGDSHLDSMGLQIQRHLKDKNIGSYAISYSGCIPIRGLYRVDKDDSHMCEEYNNMMVEFAKNNGVKTIIMIARFPLYIQGNRYDNGEGGVENGSPSYVDDSQFRNKSSKWDDEERILRVSKKLINEIEKLLKDFQVIIFSPTPEVGWNVPKYFSKKILFDEAKSYKDVQLTHNYKNYKDRVSKFNKALLSISNPNLILYDFSNLICDDIANRCITSDNKGLLYRDDDHLSPHGASMIASDFTNIYSERIKFFKIDELKYKTK